jgi:hypothetical protein
MAGHGAARIVAGHGQAAGTKTDTRSGENIMTETRRTTHVCTTGCACRTWECAACGTRDLVDRRARYETEPAGPDQYAAELCAVCGAPLCDGCVLAGLHACDPPTSRSDREWIPTADVRPGDQLAHKLSDTLWTYTPVTGWSDRYLATSDVTHRTFTVWGAPWWVRTDNMMLVSDLAGETLIRRRALVHAERVAKIARFMTRGYDLDAACTITAY